MADDLVSLFTSIGLSEQKAKETVKNKVVSDQLKQVITEVSRGEGLVGREGG